MPDQFARPDEDWRPESETERIRRQARTWTFADKLRWLEEQTELIDVLHANRRARGLRCHERPAVDWS